MMNVPLSPLQLDFCIAAMRKVDDQSPGLTAAEIDQLRRHRNAGRSMFAPAADYRWVEIEADAAKAMEKGHSDLIVETFDTPHLLVSTTADCCMRFGDEGERAWKVTKANATKDFQGKPAIGLDLDAAGGKRLGELTTEYHRRALAVIINDKVYMAPRIQSKITDKIQITGNFEMEHVELIVEALNGTKTSW